MRYEGSRDDNVSDPATNLMCKLHQKPLKNMPSTHDAVVCIKHLGTDSLACYFNLRSKYVN
jgi:hypothetical protein